MTDTKNGHGGAAMPVRQKERFAILDILRGLALVGIAVANFPEFALYTFLKPEAAAAMPTARVDGVVRFLQYVFVDGKFYTIFSLLFGIGFSIIMAMPSGVGQAVSASSTAAWPYCWPSVSCT